MTSLLRQDGQRWRKNGRRVARVRPRLRVELLEDRRLMATGATSFLFDFGTAVSPVAPGAIAVVPKTLYGPALGYGWATSPAGATDRGTSDPLTRDFNYGTANTFQVDLPNGLYNVTPTVGDASDASRESIW